MRTLRSVFVLALLVSLVALTLRPAAEAQVPAADPELEKGVQQVEEGQFEAGAATLDAAVRRLAAQGGRSQDVSRAYLYLAIAYLGLSQEAEAKAKFLAAWRLNRDLILSAQDFPPKIVRFFEEVRREAEAQRVAVASPAPAATPAPAPVVAPASPAAKGRSKTPLVIGGLAGAAAIGVAAAAGGGGGGGGPTTTATPTPAPLPSPSPSPVAVPSPSPSPSLRCVSVTVRAQDNVIPGGYLNTGVDLTRGAPLRIEASGTACYDAPQGLCTGPNGTGDAPFEGCRLGSLVGRVDSSPPVCIGGLYDQPAPFSGRLFLGYNDSDSGNNTGAFGVSICVTQ